MLTRRPEALEVCLAVNYVDMPLDVYGDSIMSVLTAADVRRRHLKREPHIGLWLLTSASVLLLNYSFQIGFATMLHLDVRRMWHREYGDGERLPEQILQLEQAQHPLPADSGALAFCRRCDVYFLQGYFMVLLLWFARVICELSEAIWLFYVILKIPPFVSNSSSGSPDAAVHVKTEDNTTSSDSESCELDLEKSQTLDLEDWRRQISPEEDALISRDGENYKVRHVTDWLRFSLLGMIVVPKIGIAVWIGYVGSEFLMLTEIAAKLVLKVLTCAYFVSIDELLFKAFISAVKQTRIKKTSIAYTQSRKSEWWANWGSSAFRALIVVAATVVAYKLHFPNVMEMRQACSAYRERFPYKGIDFAEEMEEAM